MIAFVCNSPVQIIRALHMKMRYEEFSYPADIYVGSFVSINTEIAERLRQLSIFENVYTYDHHLGDKPGAGVKLIYGIDKISKVIRERRYLKLVGFNVESFFVDALFNINYKNNGFEYYYVEDAPGIYKIYKPIDYKFTSISGMFRLKKPFYHTSKWLFSIPDMMEIPLENQRCEALKKISLKDEKFKETINYIFDYDNNAEVIDADVLIMEESFFADKRIKDNYDYNIYNKMRLDFPDLKFLVKNHPRTEVNRFENDFSIMKASKLPWELYLLNNLNDKKFPIQVGIVCCTLQSDYLMFGGEGRKLVLSPLFEGYIAPRKDGTSEMDGSFTQVFEKISRMYKNPDQVVIAKSYEEVKRGMNQLLAI